MAAGEIAVTRPFELPLGFLRGQGKGVRTLGFEELRQPQADLVHLPGHARQEIADLQPGHVGGDWPVNAADFFGGVRFQIEAVVVRQPAAKVDEND